MKKLSKIKLQDAVVLEDREMRAIFGGSGTNDICGSGVYNTVCECTGKTAVWCGNYTDGGSGALQTYCGGDGACRPTYN
ncbi:MAG: TIGR04149 family rSAM-modified RiPP [Tissierellia bacterium]|nr:TIGR04149 family rSAM-modified RiPP [Tissierellia bacterium]